MPMRFFMFACQRPRLGAVLALLQARGAAVQGGTLYGSLSMGPLQACGLGAGQGSAGMGSTGAGPSAATRQLVAYLELPYVLRSAGKASARRLRARRRAWSVQQLLAGWPTLDMAPVGYTCMGGWACQASCGAQCMRGQTAELAP